MLGADDVLHYVQQFMLLYTYICLCEAFTCCCSYSFVCFCYRLSCAAAHSSSSLKWLTISRTNAKNQRIPFKKRNNIDFYRWILIAKKALQVKKEIDWKKILNEGINKWTHTRKMSKINIETCLDAHNRCSQKHGVRFIFFSLFFIVFDLTAELNTLNSLEFNSFHASIRTFFTPHAL